MLTNTAKKEVEVEVKEIETRLEKGTYSPTNVEIVKDLLTAKKVAAARIILDSEDATRKAYAEKAAAEEAAKAVKIRKRFDTAKGRSRTNGEADAKEIGDVTRTLTFLVNGGDVPNLKAGSSFGRDYAIDVIYELSLVTNGFDSTKIAALKKRVKSFTG